MKSETGRMGEIIRTLATPQQGVQPNADDIAEATVKKLRGTNNERRLV